MVDGEWFVIWGSFREKGLMVGLTIVNNGGEWLMVGLAMVNG